MARTGQIWPDLNFQARDLKFSSKVGFHASKKPMGLDLGYLASKGPILAKSGLAWTKFGQNLSFQARDLKFMSDVCFHASSKPTGLDLGYLASKRPDLARTGQYWPNLAA